MPDLFRYQLVDGPHAGGPTTERGEIERLARVPGGRVPGRPRLDRGRDALQRGPIKLAGDRHDSP
ncbi:MAG TPA: hypothetical protein VFH48_22405 [Chloroflexota bacterium]|nr:hypothetical protein [Chloroflexota bacterium]